MIVTTATAVVGAVLLAVSLRIEPGSAWFYPSTLALALVWATGAWASGPLHLGRVGADRPVVPALLVGGGLSAVFVLGALIVREVPVLAERVSDVLAYADQGPWLPLLLVTVVNGIAEEMFFRGALFDALRGAQVSITAVAYAVVTLATGNPMLAVAALILGVVVGQLRRVSGGLLAPAIAHVTWSVTMLFVLPALF
ncbi:abortive infection protein [Nocardioides sp. Soil797]|nr:abortive infection protein [Nocardioides sp. Soil797]